MEIHSPGRGCLDLFLLWFGGAPPRPFFRGEVMGTRENIETALIDVSSEIGRVHQMSSWATHMLAGMASQRFGETIDVRSLRVRELLELLGEFDEAIARNSHELRG